MLGLLAVLVAAAIYYRLFGLIADIALVLQPRAALAVMSVDPARR